MEINGGVCNSGDKSQREAEVEGEASSLSSNVLLNHTGEVTLTLNSDGLSWEALDSSDNCGSTCLGIEFVPKITTKTTTELQFSDIYAVELIHGGMIQESISTSARECFFGTDSHDSEMNHFIVHSFQKSMSQPCLWVLAVYTFGHKDLQTCQMWMNKINDSLNKEFGRPKNLLVFVHPMSGKANGLRTWETVAPIFSRAKINTKVVVTQRAGHAFDVMTSTTNEELNSYDGAVAVGGDGFFNEILNGYLRSRHKAPFPPAPSDFLDALGNDGSSLVHDPAGAGSGTHNEESYPLLPSLAHNELGFSHLGYGFYGDVIAESEKYRWMGPKRYDYAGTKVFLKHRSYEAEVAYLEVESDKNNSIPDASRMFDKVRSLKRKKSERIICRVNCNVCNTKPVYSSARSSPATPYMRPQETRWLKSKGQFLSVGAAIMSNRNERAPDGLVADAHLSDGFLHLLLIKDCPHALYLWHLTQLARKGGNPLNFDFVEHHKLLHSRPSARRVSGIWMVSFLKHTNFQRKCFVAWFAYLHLVLRYRRRRKDGLIKAVK
ncbi:Diacylglycerol kinase family protein isoform 4 [Theobroma cacao]|uniref:Diacylglycerol kinase family protein isoform 4 n=2 Tax=Theobroma cacao TaxID=3641 RepID=A0A061G0T2_THECC|nr:Diacylglycerol kinase family protein isoform 4 [Theobroma cacao]